MAFVIKWQSIQLTYWSSDQLIFAIVLKLDRRQRWANIQTSQSFCIGKKFLIDRGEIQSYISTAQ